MIGRSREPLTFLRMGEDISGERRKSYDVMTGVVGARCRVNSCSDGVVVLAVEVHLLGCA